MTAHLRAVPRWSRASVIVDLSRGQAMTPPFTLEEHDAERAAPGPIPAAVFRGMWVAAWARAEACPLNVLAEGWLEPHCKYNPSEELWSAVAQSMREVVGVLGFGVPIRLDERKRAYAASWPVFWERN